MTTPDDEVFIVKATVMLRAALLPAVLAEGTSRFLRAAYSGGEKLVGGLWDGKGQVKMLKLQQ